MDKNRLSEAYNRAAQARGMEPQQTQTAPTPERTTISAAKSREGTALDRQAPLKPAFDQAKEPRSQSIEKQKKVKPPSRVSAASISEADKIKNTPLGKVESVKSAFDRAQAVKQPPQPQQQRDKTMVEKTGNHHTMNPPSHMRQGPDRQAHNAKLSAEQSRASKEVERAKALKASFDKARHNQPDHAKMKDDHGKDGPDLN